MKKKILIVLAIAFAAIQFIRPEKNNSDDQLFHLSKNYDVPTDVASILEKVCYDCHSNQTNYTWPFNIQPVAWWMAHHVEEGKRHLNFSDFTTRRIAVQNHKFEEIIETVKRKSMPLPSYYYLGMHSDRPTSDAQREILVNWAKAQMDTLKANYPADSLVLRRPQTQPAQ
jgi:hypothetical protein